MIVDQHGKAINFKMHSLQMPHMRALHLVNTDCYKCNPRVSIDLWMKTQAWISFMVAFLAWYSIPPVIDHIAEDLNIPSMEVYDSNMAAVAITIGKWSCYYPNHNDVTDMRWNVVARLCVGPLCERWGPRRVMSCLLVIGAIPCGLSGLLADGTGLIVLR